MDAPLRDLRRVVGYVGVSEAGMRRVDTDKSLLLAYVPDREADDYTVFYYVTPRGKAFGITRRNSDGGLSAAFIVEADVLARALSGGEAVITEQGQQWLDRNVSDY